MIKKYILKVVIVSTLFPLAFCKQPQQPSSFISFVDPLIGTAVSTTPTAQKYSEAHSELRGQTFPAVGVPFGMTHYTPQTRWGEEKCLVPYYYEDEKIQGFRGSHWMSGSCTQDYGSFTVMPMGSTLETDPEKRASSFSHQNEIATPAYYEVQLTDYGITAAMTAVERSGMLKFTFQGEQNHLVIEPNSNEGLGYIKILPEKNAVVGYNPAHRIYQGWGDYAGFKGHFYLEFDKPFSSYGVYEDGEIKEEVQSVKGDSTKVGAYLQFNLGDEKNLKVKAGTSFSSGEGALKNLNHEIKNWDFEALRTRSEQKWNKALGKVEVSGSTEKDKIKFYTSLYHSHLLPRIFNDVDGTYPTFAGNEDLRTAEGYTYYGDFALWDTYRALHPLLTILDPVRSNDMVKSVVKKAGQGNWLPIYPAWNNYTAAMIGDHALSMIGDAWLKGITDYDTTLAYRMMRKNAFVPNQDYQSYKSGKGRRALTSYKKYGYIPLEDSVKESFHQQEQVSRTLEYAYDDYILSQVAERMGEENDYDSLIKRARNYQNVIDTQTGYARGRYADGSWIKPFNPTENRVSYITEGSPFQYTWYVPHDVRGLMELMGGKEPFIARLDSFFTHDYYWHGNEPGHQTAFLYAYAGAPWKTQEQVRKIMKNEYSAGPGGLSGNEDAGQMSAWLAFNMMGFYPVCPGQPYYVMGSPVFNEIAVQVNNGEEFRIIVHNNAPQNPYIQKAELNGKPLNRAYLNHAEIMEGGKLELEMGGQPNKQWASKQPHLPPSLSD